MRTLVAARGCNTACELLGLCGTTGPGVAQISSKGFLLFQTVRTDSGYPSVLLSVNRPLFPVGLRIGGAISLLQTASVFKWSGYLTTDTEVSGSIPCATRFF